MKSICSLFYFIFLCWSIAWGSSVEKTDEVSMLRIRYFNSLVGVGLDPSQVNVKKWMMDNEVQAEGFFEKMEKQKTLRHGFIDIVLPALGKEDLQGSKNINAVFSRLKVCALVLKMEQSKFYVKKSRKNEALLRDVLRILDYMHQNYFNKETFGIYYEDLDGDGLMYPFKWVDKNSDGIKQDDEMEVRRCNWWHMEIGIPRDFNDILVLLYNDISDKKRNEYLNSIDTFIPSPNWTTGGAGGANGIWAARNVILRAILAGNPMPDDINTTRYNYSVDKLTAAKQKVENLINIFPLEAGIDKPYKEGFYTDGSCISHSRNSYTGGYGIGLLSDNLVLINLLAGSSYAVSPQKIDILYQWVTESFMTLMAYGAMADYSRGRGASRYDETGLHVGCSVLRCAVELSSLLDSDRKNSLEREIKRQLSFALTYMGDTYYDRFPPQCADQLKAIYNNVAIVIPEHYRLSKHFPIMNRFIFHGDKFIAGVAAHSKRIYNYEGLNTENHRGWHTSDGMLYLYNEDFQNYNQSFWPTYDAHYPPGTTVEEDSEMDQGNKVGRNDWCGGVTSGNHLYGCYGVQLQPAVPATLSANKSYFFFDDKIVCLGSGITDSNEDKSVYTVVENRRTSLSEISQLPKACGDGKIHWVCLPGKTEETNIAYVLYDASLLEEKIELREGTWRDIDRYALFIDTMKYSYNYYTLKINHGKQPKRASYAYAMLPGYSEERVQEFVNVPDIQILDNTEVVHAVKSRSVYMANFWGSGTTSDGFISVDASASLLWEESKDGYLLTLSDPTQKVESLTVTLSQDMNQLLVSDQRLVGFERKNNQCILKFNVKDLFGDSIRLSFNKMKCDKKG